MRIVNKDEWEQNRHSLSKELKRGVFIYPTDSIYGLGCDATKPGLVQRIRELKNSTTQPFSVIAPSKEWIYENCEVTPAAQRWVEQLGGEVVVDGEPKAVSLVLKLKNPSAVAGNVLQGYDSLSVRMPNHWFTGVVSDLGVPVVTTSANPTGGNFMTSLDDLHEKIRQGAELCIYEGEKKGTPSTLVHLDKGQVQIRKR